MPSLRNQIRHDESDPKSLQPFDTDDASLPYMSSPTRGSDWVDKVVKLSATGTVQKAADGDEILGVLEQVTDAKTCRVQTHGLRVLPCGSAATFAFGVGVVADATGGVKAAVSPAGTGRALYKPSTTTVLVDL